MTLNTIPDLPSPPSGPAATPPAAQPAATAAPLLPPAPAFITARQLAAALGVSRRTLTTWNQRGVIPSVCVGRVRRYELEAVKTALRAHGQAAAKTSSAPATDAGSGGNSGTTAAA